MALDGILIELPDFNGKVFATGGEDEALRWLDAEVAEGCRVRDDSDVFVRIAVDWLSDQTQDAVRGREDLELVVLALLFGIPHSLEATLFDLSEVWALISVLEAIFDERKEFNLVVGSGYSE